MNGIDEKFDWTQKSLYRAKNVNTNKWEIGFIYDEENQDNVIPFVTNQSVTEGEIPHVVQVYRCTLGKYSGVDDIDYMMIFEGDILSHFGDLAIVVNDNLKYKSGGHPRGFIVNYLNGSPATYPVDYFVYGDIGHKQSRVVGNIFDGMSIDLLNSQKGVKTDA